MHRGHDGVVDSLDPDKDNDGTPNCEEDDDGDGIPNNEDNDDDGDGIPDHLDDDDGDGIPNNHDTDDDGDGTPDAQEDDDGDGIPNNQDNDDDGDGTPDHLEDDDGDGLPNNQDTDDDGDGIPDHEEDDDGDSYPNNEDWDDDGDGVGDHEEDDDGDGTPNNGDYDNDGDGTPDHEEDDDGDGVPNNEDLDDDDDGTLDIDEDDDRDDVPNHDDTDDDGDGTFDPQEDDDNDGTQNENDNDDDGDGTPDGQEDPDGDGIPNDQDPDDDNDGTPDGGDPGNGGGGGPGGCAVRLEVRAAGFYMEKLYDWPDGDPTDPTNHPTLAPMVPPKRNDLPLGWEQDYHYDVTRGGALYPVVLGFNDYAGVVRLVYRIKPGSNCTEASIRARVGQAVLATSGGPLLLDGEVGEDIPILLFGDLLEDRFPQSDRIGVLTYSVVFEYSTDEQTWHAFGQARPTKWYVLPHRSAEPEPYGKRFDRAVEKIVRYATGLRHTPLVAAALSAGIAGDICYDPETQLEHPTTHPLYVYWMEQMQCKEKAFLLKHLADSAGAFGTSVVYYWSGTAANRRTLYHTADQQQVATFQLDVPANDRETVDPHFAFHAVSSIAGSLFDPSYGAQGLPGIIESHAGTSPQQSSTWPTADDVVQWLCPHLEVPLVPCP